MKLLNMGGFDKGPRTHHLMNNYINAIQFTYFDPSLNKQFTPHELILNCILRLYDSLVQWQISHHINVLKHQLWIDGIPKNRAYLDP